MGASEPVDVVARLGEVRDRIAVAARGAGRDPGAVRLVGAAKSVDAAVVGRAVAAGLVDVGENRAQELVAKAADPRCAGARWHFIGHLQRNKVAAVAPVVVCWHSVDRPELGTPIARHAPGARVLVQVALVPEPTKGGCPPDAVPALVDALSGLGLDVAGLMTVPPVGEPPARWFAALRGLAGRLGLAELSMGMSDDLEVAVAEGATMVRVGRALFGPRPDPAGVRR